MICKTNPKKEILTSCYRWLRSCSTSSKNSIDHFNVCQQHLLEAVNIVRSQLQKMRNASSFMAILNNAVTAAAQLNLASIELPRQHKPPERSMLMLPQLLKIITVSNLFSFLTSLSHSYHNDSIETRLALPMRSWRQCF